MIFDVRFLTIFHILSNLCSFLKFWSKTYELPVFLVWLFCFIDCLILTVLVLLAFHSGSIACWSCFELGVVRYDVGSVFISTQRSGRDLGLFKRFLPRRCQVEVSPTPPFPGDVWRSCLSGSHIASLVS